MSEYICKACDQVVLGIEEQVRPGVTVSTKIKCPHCGWKSRIFIDRRTEDTLYTLCSSYKDE